MTHVDPFAPADSPQHPANFGADGTYTMSPAGAEDLAPLWIRIPGEPISSDTDVHPNPDDIADARWEEYEQLLREVGDPESIEYLDRPTAEWPEGMPTLTELRDRAAQATGTESIKADAEAELAAALAALDEDDR